MLKWVGAAFLAPAAVAAGYGEAAWPFLVSAVITAGCGLGLDQITGEKRGIEFEGRVFRRCADQHDRPIFHDRQEAVLL